MCNLRDNHYSYFLPPEYVETRFVKDEAEKASKIDKFVKTTLPDFLKNAEKLLKQRGGQTFTGSKVRMSDSVSPL